MMRLVIGNREARVGVISDTHGLLRPWALTALKGADLIVHAGDVGAPEVLSGLTTIAPVRAVRGNADTETWAEHLPETAVVEVEGSRFYVLHDLEQLDLDPAVAVFGAVISGHSHRPRIEKRRGVLYLNPGSAGPRRFQLPVSLAWLYVSDGRFRAELLTPDE